MKLMMRTIVFLSAIFLAVLSHANLSEGFSKQFEGTTVQTGGSGTFELSGRTLHSGGYVRVRVPVVGAPNPVKFQEPSIKGGCNGFDIYGGSFSYISSGEIITWLNHVVNNSGALSTYMFLSYLQSACSVCSEVMQTLYSMQDMLNMSMQDSCTTATAMVDGIQGAFTGKETPSWDSYSDGVRRSAMTFSDSVGIEWDDSVGAVRAGEKSLKNITEIAQPDRTKREKEFYGGNMIYWIVQETDAIVDFRKHMSRPSITKKQLHIYLTAIVGNQVNFIDEASPDTQTSTLGTYLSKVSLADFITSSYVNNVIPADCGSWPSATSCKDPADIVFKDGFADIKPFIDKFKCVMEGENSKGQTCGSGLGVIGKLGRMKDDVGVLSPEEQVFIRDFLPGFNFGAMMVSLSPSPAAMRQFYECTSEVLMNDYALHQTSYAIKLVKRYLEGVNFGNGVGGTRKSAFLKYLESRERDLNNEFSEMQNNVVGKSNCRSDSIETYLQFKEYSQEGSK